MILGDFNVRIERSSMVAFCNNYKFTSLTKQPTRYKNPNNPTCIDLILSTTPRSFQSTCIMETKLSYFHLRTLNVIKRALENSNPDLSVLGPTRTSQMKRLLEKLSNEVFVNTDNKLKRFCEVLNQHAPQKIR